MPKAYTRWRAHYPGDCFVSFTMTDASAMTVRMDGAADAN